MKNTIFDLEIDFKKSKNSFLFDKKTNKKYLDFFGQYSTLTLGYNSDIFKKQNIKKKLIDIFPQKIVNCELDSDVQKNFRKKFKRYLGSRTFNNFHFCSTVALAVEAAIKTTIYYSKKKSKNIIVMSGNFHGINGYGGIFTDRFDSVLPRLKYFPGSYINHIDVDGIFHPSKDKKNENYIKIIKNIETKIKKENSCAVLIEPIQSTFGDRYFEKFFLKQVATICKKNDIPLIFDEIQTGFYTSGKKWYFQHIGITPDIVVFGKKTQVSGIMMKNKFSKILGKENILNVTWNSDIIDMYRCQIIIEFLEKNNSLKKINNLSDQISSFLQKFDLIKNVRSKGYLIAFDLTNSKIRDKLVKKLFKNGVLVNPTRSLTIRLRPNLNTNLDEIILFKKIFNKSLNEIKS